MSEHPIQTVRIALSWLIVAIPLGYGLDRTMVAVAKLFS